MHTTRDENSVFELTKRAIEESEARIASLQREITLLHESIAQNRTFLERIEKSSRVAGGGSVVLLDRLGGSAKSLSRAGRDPRAANSAPRADDKRLRGGQTYAASILEVLAKNPSGLTTAELTEHFRTVRHPISTREDAGKAVSNQLSQLKGRNLIVRDRNKRFTIIEM
ncbi:MAG: hypothetical protein IAI49_13530 [Candidatus Eremiobacteraeota bacterium]|nr:hypothetical protein [Candidatus Eremiobacteraeota bacterium]